MTATLAALLEPATVAGLSLRNRVVMAPMTRSRSPGGVPGEDVAAYYARRAADGVGLIITEGVAIDRPGASDDPDEPGVPRLAGVAEQAGWRGVVRAVHAAGGRIMIQLWHVGATAGRRAQWRDGDTRVESPSGFGTPGEPLGRAMSDVDIADTIAAYAEGAALARRIGFDGVEIHGAHGYLIDQFLWAATNHRTDGHGGTTVAARTRFATDVVRAVRAAVSGDYPVAFRFSQFKQQDYSAKLADTPADLEALLRPLADAGASMLHASQRRFWTPAFDGSDLNLAGWAKRVTGLPSITVGSVGLSSAMQDNWAGGTSAPTDIAALLERLCRREFDLVAVGRALLNDPRWLGKLAAGDHAGMIPYDNGALARYH